jgi:tetratricopeptide (TPR) repeat protein
MGQYQRGIDDFNEALRINPRMRSDLLAAVLAIRGLAYQKMGQDDLALADLERALKIDPNMPILYVVRAAVYLDMRDFDRAIEDTNIALRINQHDADALSTRALAYLMKGDYDRALADAEAAVRINPQSPLAVAVRGIANLKKENYDQAIADMMHAMELGDSPDLSNFLREARDAKVALALRQPPPPTSQRPLLANRIALVIGNGSYQSIAGLPNAENDATDVGQALTAMGYKVFGYPKTNFTLAEMNAQIDAFQRAAVTADTALIWYAGHGQEFLSESEVGRNWLLPVDAKIDRPADVGSAGVPMSRLINAAVPARFLRIVIVDACRNSNLPTGTRAITPRLAIEQRSGMMIVFSTRSGTVALDGEGRNSPFAAAFLDAARDKSHLDVRQFFGAVARGTLERTKNAQEPELLVRLQTEALLPLVPE